MDSNEQQNAAPENQHLGTLPQRAATYGNLPQDAATYRNVPQEIFGRENYSLSVKEAARMFELEGVPRIERSITNWCQPNRQGISRLDCYFEESERKWYITPESAERAIGEEKAKARAAGLYQEPQSNTDENNVRQDAATSTATEAVKKIRTETSPDRQQENEKTKKLEDENFLLASDVKAKEHLVTYLKNQIKEDREQFNEQLRKTQEHFTVELVKHTKRVGQLEMELRQLEAPRQGTRDAEFQETYDDEQKGRESVTYEVPSLQDIHPEQRQGPTDQVIEQNHFEQSVGGVGEPESMPPEKYQFEV